MERQLEAVVGRGRGSAATRATACPATVQVTCGVLTAALHLPTLHCMRIDEKQSPQTCSEGQVSQW